MQFNDLLGLIHSRGQWQSLEDDEAELLYTHLMSLPSGARVLEIGCELGRSSVVLASVAKERNFDLHFCDIWVSGGSYAAEWISQMHALGHPFTLHMCRSSSLDLDGDLDLLYIDGDHTEAGIVADCSQHLLNVSIGGYVLFHDYGRDSLPEVKPTTDRFMRPEYWAPAGTARTMASWKRIEEKKPVMPKTADKAPHKPVIPPRPVKKHK